jgi:hypothetical protein
LISDLEVARYLRAATERKERNARLLHPLSKAHQASGDTKAGEPDIGRPIHLDRPHLCQPEDSIRNVLDGCNGLPALVTRSETGELLGIVTAFDLL